LQRKDCRFQLGGVLAQFGSPLAVRIVSVQGLPHLGEPRFDVSVVAELKGFLEGHFLAPEFILFPGGKCGVPETAKTLRLLGL
jgi:hypothetical protein